MQIESMLNPAPSTPNRRQAPRVERKRVYYDETSSSNSPEPTPSKKSLSKKAPKDAPKWDEGLTVGQVRFPPYNVSTSELVLLKNEFKFYAGPKGNVEMYPEHIPYSSDKKNFLAKTGREAFEVFHYTFKHKDGSEPEKDWVVMWDYNIGLVRITPFFKCMPGHRKTDPKNAILASPGLMDLCHSITGGAILAQGYWLPYPAARALASTFTYSIRYALVPLFGSAFPPTCVHPNNPLFNRWSIPATIVTSCTNQVRYWTRTPPKKTTAFSKTGSSLATASITTTRTLRKKSRLRPRDIGVYDPSDLDSGDEAQNMDIESTSTTTTAKRNDSTDADYAATPTSNTDTEVSKSSWSAANTPVYPTPPHYPPPFTFTTSAGKRTRADSECISPLTTTSTATSATKRKRSLQVSGRATTSSEDTMSDADIREGSERTIHPSGCAVKKGMTRRIEPDRIKNELNRTNTPYLHAADDSIKQYENEGTKMEDEDESDDDDDGNDEEGTQHGSKKRRMNRKTGRFYADEFGAAQALVKMSEGCWGAALR